MNWDVNNLVSLASFIAGVLGLLSGYYFYRASLAVKEPLWVNETIVFLRGGLAVPGLELHYKGQAVDNIAVTYFLFWNNGNDVLEGSDFIDSNPLRIVFGESGKIMDVSLLVDTFEGRHDGIQLNIQDNYVQVNFAYLNRGDGFGFRVIHTGRNLENIKVEGKAIGVASIKRVDPSSNVVPQRLRKLFELQSQV